MSDLKELMDEAIGGYMPRLDEEAVRQRVEGRRQGGRIMATAVAIGVVVGAGWFGWTALRPASTTVPATDSGTYILTDFEVGPSDGLRPPKGRATVSYQVFWSSDVYPGHHACSVRVYDSAGNLIGSLTDEIIALSEGHRGKSWVQAEGSIHGATADGSCSPERLDTPVAYAVKDLGIDVSRLTTGTLIQVIFKAESPEGLRAGADPGANACQAAIFTKEGRLIKTSNFNVMVGTEGRVEVDFPDYTGELPSTANVVCEPFTRVGEFPDATGS
jgi:hypothetical protein